jgi:parvulin-like peptidyl-prolyl isomerase
MDKRMQQKKKKVNRPKGIMNKMRDKMPLIIIILIVAFLGTIIFEWGMDYLGMSGQSITFGEVNGNEITYQEYDMAVQQQIEQMRTQNEGKDIDEETVEQIREQVWNNLVTQKLTRQEINKLGIKVSDGEILDWIYNRPETLPDMIKRNFMDSTGVFSMAIYQSALNDKRQEVREFWNQVELFLRETLLSEKLQSIIVSSVIVTEGDVLQKYKDDNIYANFEYLLLDLNTIPDSLVEITDEELRIYYDNHQDEFKQEEAVKFRYIVFPDVPTAEDSVIVEKQLKAYLENIKNSSIEDSSLIKLVSDISATPYNENYQKPNVLGKGALDFLFAVNTDSVSDLIIDQDGYKIVRYLDSRDGEELYVSASHILVNFGVDTLAAMKKAEDILKRAKGGDNFGELAFNISEDPSAKQNRGELGWFTKGAMVPEFENAAMNGNVGDIVGPIKTRYGYHLLKINGKSRKEFKLAEIKMIVKAGSRTREAARKGAEDFIYSIEEGGANIDTLALSLKLPVLVTPDVNQDGVIPGAGQNKSLIDFGFDSDIGEMDGPFKIQGGYAAYQLADKIPEGYKNFDSIKTILIKPKVLMEKKYAILEQVTNELMGKIQNGDLNTLIAIYPNYIIETADSVSVSKPFAKIGADYALNSVVFNMKPGELSSPIKGNTGYYIVKVNSITPFNEQAYLSMAVSIRNQLMQAKQQAVVQEWLLNLKNNADIVDNRDRFF